MPQAATPPKLIHIFKPGRFTTAAGEVIEFSEADIEAMARAYDPKLHKAPLVVGHPKTDDPAKGWAKALTATKRGLYAAPEKVDVAFAESVNGGAYGKVSAKFYRPTDAANPVPGVWYLRHVGFLGAQPPGVKGLDEPEFSESDDGCVCFQEGVEFSAWDDLANAGLWRSMRDWFLASFGQETADRVIPNYQVQQLESSAQQELKDETQRGPAFAEPPAPSSQPQESTVTDEEAAQLRDKNAALERQNEELRKAQAEAAAKARHTANVEFAESLVNEARIPSAQKDQVAAICSQLETTPDVEFGEGEAKKPLHQLFRDFLKALPPSVEFAEQASMARVASDASAAVQFAEGADPDRVALDKRIRAYAKDNATDYVSAAHAVMRSK